MVTYLVSKGPGKPSSDYIMNKSQTKLFINNQLLQSEGRARIIQDVFKHCTLYTALSKLLPGVFWQRSLNSVTMDNIIASLNDWNGNLLSNTPA